MPKVPPYFRRSGENVIASYDYYDISEGTGITEFCAFAACTANTPTYEYGLTTSKTLYSARQGYYANPNGVTLTFDCVFNQQKVVKGTAYIRVPFLNVATSKTSNITGTIYHYDGTTETAISSSIQSEDFANGGTAVLMRSLVIKLALTEKTFAAGDTLRVKIACYSDDASAQIYFSPVGTQITSGASGETMTRLSVFIPFKIQL